MKKYFLFLLCSQLIAHSPLLSQDIFISKGKIEFEKKVNLYRNLEDEQSSEDGGFDWVSEVKKQLPEWNTAYFNLYFDGDKTLYQPGRESTQAQKVPTWYQGPAEDNVVYCDLNADKSISQKTVYESIFLI